MKKSLRVLVVEDSLDDFDLLIRELRRGGFDPNPERVQTEGAMSAALDRESWDAVLSDWSMPEFSATAALRVLHEKGFDIPFIIISGTVGEDIAVEALKTGAHDFLVKDKLARLIPAIDREMREAGVRRERQKMQEQLLISDRMASVGLLAAGVGHEINNPLASVLANLECALRDTADLDSKFGSTEETRDLSDVLANAKESAERIRNIVRDLKLFSRSDDDRRSAVQVHAVLDSTIRMAWNEVRHRAKLTKDFQTVPAVFANESRLGQVFLNLIVNAAQAIPEGHAEGNEIRVTTGMDTAGRVVVEISDTGTGMSPEHQKKLFTPFFTTKSVGVGTGLGLSICHRIINDLGGEITVESAVGKGSTFRVSMPAADSAGISLSEESTPVTESAPRRGQVLIIDDEALVASALRAMLEREHDVTTTQRATDAYALFTQGTSFDVILCDLMMPEMTGMDLYDKLLESNPDQAKKMIFMTGGAFTARARTFLETVSNPHIEKPFRMAEIRSIVNKQVL